MNCPYCDNELVDEDAPFCPKCGKSLAPEGELEQISVGVPRKQTDLVLAAALLTIIAAAFIASGGSLYLDQYNVVILNLIYYAPLTASDFLGFLLIGILRIVLIVPALIGSIFMLSRKRFKISILGAVFPIVSVLLTFIIAELIYNYGYTGITIFLDETPLIISIVSVMLLLKSKAEFT